MSESEQELQHIWKIHNYEYETFNSVWIIRLNSHLLLNSKYTISEYNEVYEVRTALLTNHDVET